MTILGTDFDWSRKLLLHGYASI